MERHKKSIGEDDSEEAQHGDEDSGQRKQKDDDDGEEEEEEEEEEEDSDDEDGDTAIAVEKGKGEGTMDNEAGPSKKNTPTTFTTGERRKRHRSQGDSKWFQF